MNKVVAIIVVLSVYMNDSIIQVDAQTAGVAKLPFLSATASSTYANNAACYGPLFGADGYSDTSSCKFFHSKATGGFPWWQGVLAPSTKVVSVTLKSRCDANGWGHTQFTVVVRAGTTAFTTTDNAGTSLLTQNTLCGSYTGTVPQCSTISIACPAALAALDSTVLSVQLYTNGGNVHLMFEDVTVVSTAAATVTSSSVYYCPYGDFSGYWGPKFAIDGAQSSTWWGMFHSCHETYPWFQMKLPTQPTTVNTVTIRSRCDANAWSCSVPNNINVQVRAGLTETATTFKGQITVNTLCGTKVGCDASACTTTTIACAAVSSNYVTVQMVDATKTFLMLDEVTVA